MLTALISKKPWNKYYWLDIVKLFEQFMLPHQELVAVKYFSARPLGDPDKSLRQNAFFQANLENRKFKLILGKYLKKRLECFKCHNIINTYEEKESDVYNRENETSTILKRNEQIFSFFASFFSCSFDRLNIILTPIKSHSKRLKIGVSLCFLSCLLRHSGQTLQLHFRPKVRAFSLHCSRKCERFQGST